MLRLGVHVYKVHCPTNVAIIPRIPHVKYSHDHVGYRPYIAHQWPRACRMWHVPPGTLLIALILGLWSIESKPAKTTDTCYVCWTSGDQVPFPRQVYSFVLRLAIQHT